MQSEREQVVSLVKRVLLDLVSVYTPSGEESKARETLERIANYLDLPLRVDDTNSYYFGKGNERILLASHIDTVPGYLPPFDDGNAVSGRGAVDAKGPLSAMLVASSLLRREGCEVEVAALSDEEAFSRGAKKLATSGRTFDFIVIGEPTSTTGIGIEYRGVMHLDIKCKSASSHASSGQVNVIVKVAEGLQKVYSPPKDYDTPTVTPTIFRSGEAINVIPSEAYLHLDVRFSARNDPEAILKGVAETFRDCEVTVTERLEPVKVSPNSQLVRAVMRALLKQGQKPNLVRKWGTSDMNILYKVSREIVAYGPGDSRLEHTDHERITYEELYIGTMTYYNAIKGLCGKYSG